MTAAARLAALDSLPADELCQHGRDRPCLPWSTS